MKVFSSRNTTNFILETQRSHFQSYVYMIILWDGGIFKKRTLSSAYSWISHIPDTNSKTLSKRKGTIAVMALDEH